MDFFTTRQMLPLVEREQWAPAFLRDHFFKRVETFETAAVEYDILDDKNSICPASRPGSSVVIQNKGWKTVTREPIVLSAEIQTKAEEILANRAAGQNCYSTQTPDQRLAEKIKRDLEYLDRSISCAEEKFCRDVLIYGNLKAEGPDIVKNENVWDYLPTENQPVKVFSGTALWSATTTADPLKDFREAIRAIGQTSQVSATECVMGVEAAEAFMAWLKANDIVLDTRRLDLGLIKPEALKNGVEYWGRIGQLDIYVYSHELTYFSYDTSGVATKKNINIFPTKAVLIGSPDAQCSMLYGAVPLVKKEDDFSFVASARVPYSTVSDRSPKGRILSMESRVLPICKEPLAFRVLWPLGKQNQE